MSEQRYTLAEARLEMRRQQCSRHGHDFDIIQSMGEPVRLVCPCGRYWSVISGDGSEVD